MSGIDDMIEVARRAMERAYAPYSNFPVGAVVRSESGKLYAGCNVENSAYPQGWCAEASAIAAMVAAGERRIVEVAVMGRGEALVMPCGGCRGMASSSCSLAVQLPLVNSASSMARPIISLRINPASLPDSRESLREIYPKGTPAP